MKKTNTQVILSEKFQKSMEHMNMYEHLTKKSQRCFGGTVKKLDNDFYVVLDEQGKDVCGMLDQKSFMEALLETDVAHLWSAAKN